MSPRSESPSWVESPWQDHPAVIWSTVNAPVLRALCQAADGLPVQLGLEPDNPVDPGAVMILLSSRTVQRLLDLTPVTVGDDDHLPQPTDWRLGYLRRDDPARLSLRQRLAEQEAPLDARLQVEGATWAVRVWAESDPDEEIPY